MRIGVLKAVSDGTRLKLLKMLEGGELCACYFPKRLGVSQPASSQHLKVLLEAGLVKVRVEGVKRMYSLSKKGLVVLRDIGGW